MESNSCLHIRLQVRSLPAFLPRFYNVRHCVPVCLEIVLTQAGIGKPPISLHLWKVPKLIPFGSGKQRGYPRQTWIIFKGALPILHLGLDLSSLTQLRGKAGPSTHLKFLCGHTGVRSSPRLSQKCCVCPSAWLLSSTPERSALLPGLMGFKCTVWKCILRFWGLRIILIRNKH